MMEHSIVPARTPEHRFKRVAVAGEFESCSCPPSYSYFGFTDDGSTLSCDESGVWGDLTGDGSLSPEDVQTDASAGIRGVAGAGAH